VIGDGLLPETTMGPLNNAKQLKVVTNMIAEARAAGQDVHNLGKFLIRPSMTAGISSALPWHSTPTHHCRL
tara:strand:+ start:66 stop:278 length:213 start_codon:yes stop_codon:yes gene_type:complete